MPNLNGGEIDELKAKLALIYWRDNNLNNISKVGLNREFKSHNMSIESLIQLTNDEVIALTKKIGAYKAPAAFKADVVINEIPYSLKSHRNAPPALLNTTHRAGILKVCERINLDITRLDKLILDYWQKRTAGICKEDVKYQDGIFSQDEDAMVDLLKYFLFTGTARGISKLPAKEIYEICEPFDFDKWKVRNSDDVTRDILKNTRISMRSKGMNSYTETSNTKPHQNMRLWTRYHQDAYRGAIHIRG